VSVFKTKLLQIVGNYTLVVVDEVSKVSVRVGKFTLEIAIFCTGDKNATTSTLPVNSGRPKIGNFI
jgi:hypothetical protein